MINKSMAGDLIVKRKEHALMGWSIPIAAAMLKLECLLFTAVISGIGVSDSKCRWRGRARLLSD